MTGARRPPRSSLVRVELRLVYRIPDQGELLRWYLQGGRVGFRLVYWKSWISGSPPCDPSQVRARARTQSDPRGEWKGQVESLPPDT